MPTCASCGHELPEGAKFCLECGAPVAPAAASREQRKTVTILFCDVADSTALGESTDPEALRALLARYFQRMKEMVERHGGSVEKFIGDAVMAVFGVPVVHEDDALRACRAAIEMREALPELGICGRIGLNTGEVVTGTEERLATGDAVNVAARLEQAAEPGEVLIGESTLRLVAEVVDAEPFEPLALKGKTEPVPAYRLAAVTAEPTRRNAAPMIGRTRQQRLLADAFANVVDDRACHLFTVLGAAGVGKSRLAAEFLGGLGATVVRGRCLSYGEGVTLWPVVEALQELGMRPEDEQAAAAIASALGESDVAVPTDEIAWAVRKTFEQAARDGPLVVVWDDLHWAEPSFLDLVEHVADWSRGAPILLLCMARPELLDRRPAWSGGKLNATTVLLEPLSAEETDELIASLAPVDPALRARVREAAEGNPLFVEEMLALVQDSGGGDIAVPPTIQALLAARLDQLDAPERAVLERGAVEGKVFHRGAVEALAPEERQVAQRLLALVRKELVRPDEATVVGDDAFRFRHLLIRDAAYDALPKAVRIDLHRRFAAWLELRGSGLAELDEILGHHLEQAWRYLRELGQPDDPELRDAAHTRLRSALWRAMNRRDYPAAVGLAERLRPLTPEGTFDVGVEIDRVDALALSGDMEPGWDAVQDAVARARATGDRLAEICMLLEAGIWEGFLRPGPSFARLDALARSVLPELEAIGDDYGLYLVYWTLAHVAQNAGRVGDQLGFCKGSLAHAERLPSRHYADWVLPGLFGGHFWGATPVDELLAWLDEHEPGASAHNNRFLLWRAGTVAMAGRASEAAALVTELVSQLRDRGRLMELAMGGQGMSWVYRRTGELERAAEVLAQSCAFLEERGERGILSTDAALSAEVLLDLGRADEAETWAARAAELGAPDDLITRLPLRRAQARLAALRGWHAAGEALGREAVDAAVSSGRVLDEAQAHEALAEVLERAGKPDEAAAALEQAATLYARKGDVADEARVRARVVAARA